MDSTIAVAIIAAAGTVAAAVVGLLNRGRKPTSGLQGPDISNVGGRDTIVAGRDAVLIQQADPAWSLPASARVVVRLVRGHAGTTVVISNAGPADAGAVNLTFPEGSCPILRDEMSKKLPIPSLPAGADVQFIAAPSHDIRPPFHAQLEWTDSAGRQSAAFMLT